MKKRYFTKELPDFSKGDIILAFEADEDGFTHYEERLRSDYKRSPDVKLLWGKLNIEDGETSELIGGVLWWDYIEE